RARDPSVAETEHARWVALRDARPVGRVAAFAPRAPADVGYFGTFECIDDQPAARALLEAAETWLLARGRRTCIGPLLVNQRAQIGLLIYSVDRLALILTPFNT